MQSLQRRPSLEARMYKVGIDGCVRVAILIDLGAINELANIEAVRRQRNGEMAAGASGERNIARITRT